MQILCHCESHPYAYPIPDIENAADRAAFSRPCGPCRFHVHGRVPRHAHHRDARPAPTCGSHDSAARPRRYTSDPARSRPARHRRCTRGNACASASRDPEVRVGKSADVLPPLARAGSRPAPSRIRTRMPQRVGSKAFAASRRSNAAMPESGFRPCRRRCSPRPGVANGPKQRREATLRVRVDYGHVARNSLSCSLSWSSVTSRQWMPQQRPRDQRSSDRARQQPVDKRGKVFPDWQVRAVVDIERDDQHHVG